MCDRCDYNSLLTSAGLEATANRLQVLAIIGANNYPLTASEIFTTIERSQTINKVTVYRILDLLVASRVVERIRIGGRAAYYGIAPNEHHAPHPHFYCIKCATIDCLPPGSLSVNTNQLQKTFPGKVERVEVQVEGICRNCLRS